MFQALYNAEPLTGGWAYQAKQYLASWAASLIINMCVWPINESPSGHLYQILFFSDLWALNGHLYNSLVSQEFNLNLNKSSGFVSEFNFEAVEILAE